MQTKTKEQRTTAAVTARPAEVLDVRGAAALLTVSPDTIYDLFQKGELPGRKVGRKWITTKTAVLRWIENTSADDALTRAVERGDRDALTKALNKRKVRVRSKGD